MSKDIPIIFSAPMVRALLQGWKTQTRRILSPENLRIWTGGLDHGGSYVKPDEAMFAAATNNARDFRSIDGRLAWVTDPAPHQRGAVMAQWMGRLPWSVGDRLWVREAVAYINNSEFGQPSYWEYRADTNGRDFPGDWPPEEKDNPERPRWRPAIHMPREASRLTLIVTGMKIERLRSISREDAIAEGATWRPKCYGYKDMFDGWSMDWSEVGTFSHYATGGPGPLREGDICLCDPISAFGSFINLLHGGPRWNLPGKPTPVWDQNPFVVAVTFLVIKANIDAPEARAA